MLASLVIALAILFTLSNAHSQQAPPVSAPPARMEQNQSLAYHSALPPDLSIRFGPTWLGWQYEPQYLAPPIGVSCSSPASEIRIARGNAAVIALGQSDTLWRDRCTTTPMLVLASW